MGMKRKQVVIDKLEDMDNHLISLAQAFNTPTLTKEKAEQYVTMVREKLKEIQNMVNLEDHAY